MESQNTLQKSAEAARWQKDFKLEHFPDMRIFMYILVPHHFTVVNFCSTCRHVSRVL